MERSYSVYVIELSAEAGKRRRAAKPCVYVGQTVHTPQERFDQHRSGYKAAGCVRRYGLRLRPRLYESWNPIATREDALAAEARLADRLARRGFTVFGGH